VPFPVQQYSWRLIWNSMETPWHVNVNVIVVVIVIVIVIAIVNVARALQDLEIQLPLQLGTGQHATFNLRGDTNVRTVRRG
jgi:hypothetical protein